MSSTTDHLRWCRIALMNFACFLVKGALFWACGVYDGRYVYRIRAAVVYVPGALNRVCGCAYPDGAQYACNWRLFPVAAVAVRTCGRAVRINDWCWFLLAVLSFLNLVQVRRGTVVSAARIIALLPAGVTSVCWRPVAYLFRCDYNIVERVSGMEVVWVPPWR